MLSKPSPLTDTHRHSPLPTLTFTDTHIHPHSLSLILTDTHLHRHSPSLTLTITNTHSNSSSPSPTLTFTDTHRHSPSPTLTLTHPHSPSPTLTDTDRHRTWDCLSECQTTYGQDIVLRYTQNCFILPSSKQEGLFPTGSHGNVFKDQSQFWLSFDQCMPLLFWRDMNTQLGRGRDTGLYAG